MHALAALEHVFRHAGGELIDTPDLPLPTRGVPWRWVALVWPDPTRPDGWAALEWDIGVRGWHLPGVLTAGDIIEFGTVGLDPQQRAIGRTAHHWYGWLEHLTPHAAIIVGPYPTATAAQRAAQPTVDQLRCAQLSWTSSESGECDRWST